MMDVVEQSGRIKKGLALALPGPKLLLGMTNIYNIPTPTYVHFKENNMHAILML